MPEAHTRAGVVSFYRRNFSRSEFSIFDIFFFVVTLFYFTRCLIAEMLIERFFVGPMGNNSGNKTATLPHRLSLDRANSTSRDREGYYSDRNELARERERGYLSDREQRERGYLSDHNISSLVFLCTLFVWS